METTLKITGNWSELKTKLRKKYAKLTDEDLRFTKGKEEELLDRLENKLGKSRDEISEFIDELQSRETESESEPERGSRKESTAHKGSTHKESAKKNK